MPSNGHLTAAQLTPVQGDIQLEHATAAAWRALVAAAKTELHRAIGIAEPEGGYRSFAVQDAMQEASVGHDAAAKRRWGLSTVSTAHLASPGTSNHGLGVCVDVVGTPVDAAFLALAKRYGFTRPLAGDPNHFLYDGHTVVHAPAAAAAKPAAGYVVVAGDTFSGIAARHHLTTARLQQLNPAVTDPARIRVGLHLRTA